MILEVYWKNKKRTNVLGKNGSSVCIGVELYETYRNQPKRHCVEILPLNTRGGITRCHIDIPIESIPEIVEQLEKINQQEKFFVEKGEEDDDNRGT